MEQIKVFVDAFNSFDDGNFEGEMVAHITFTHLEVEEEMEQERDKGRERWSKKECSGEKGRRKEWEGTKKWSKGRVVDHERGGRKNKINTHHV